MELIKMASTSPFIRWALVLVFLRCAHCVTRLRTSGIPVERTTLSPWFRLDRQRIRGLSHMEKKRIVDEHNRLRKTVLQLWGGRSRMSAFNFRVLFRSRLPTCASCTGARTWQRQLNPMRTLVALNIASCRRYLERTYGRPNTSAFHSVKQSVIGTMR